MSPIEVFIFYALTGNIVVNGIAGLPSAYGCFIGIKPRIAIEIVFLVCSVMGASIVAMLSYVAPVPSPLAFIAYIALGTFSIGFPQLIRKITRKTPFEVNDGRGDNGKDLLNWRLDFEIALFGTLLTSYQMSLDFTLSVIAGVGAAIGRSLALFILWILLAKIDLESPKVVRNSLPIALSALALIGLVFTGIGR